MTRSTSERWLRAHVALAWLVCGIVAALLAAHHREGLAARERPRQEPIEMQARGVRKVRRRDFAADIECASRTCHVDVRVGRGPNPPALSLVADRGRWITVLQHGSVLLAIDPTLAPRVPRASAHDLLWAILLSLFVATQQLVRAGRVHREILTLRSARPCRVSGTTIELLDGASPRAARISGEPSCEPSCEHGWAVVLEGTPLPCYRDLLLPRAELVSDRDERLLASSMGRSGALMALSALATVWLMTALAWM